MKVNHDGAFFTVVNSNGGLGAIIRDDEGDVVICGMGKTVNILNPLHAELWWQKMSTIGYSGADCNNEYRKNEANPFQD